MNDQHEDEVELSLTTALGKVVAKGVRTSSLINLAALAGVVAISFFLWRITTELVDHEARTTTSNNLIALEIKSWTKAVRLQTCILSQSQEDRQKEFLAPNGWCKMMSETP